MKNTLLAILCTVTFSFASFAQGQAKGDIEFGVNLGINGSTAGNSNGNYDSGYGFNIGASGDYFFSDRWSLKLKVIYDQKGWDGLFVDAADNFYEGHFNLNYVTVPVMANWHFGGKRNWYLNAGPYAGFLLGAKETERGDDYKDAFKSTDFGIALGIGVKIPLNDKLKLSLEYDEQTGLSEIYKTNDFKKISNRRSSFNVGLNFLLK